MVGIYKIENLINNKIYVGKSEVSVENRLNEHKKGYKSNQHLQRAIKRYGIDNFTFEILEECSKEDCCEKERQWINKLNCMFPNGYNYTSGGENASGFTYSEVSKIKMSKSAKIRCSNSIECQRMSQMASDRVWNSEDRIKVSNTLKELYKDKTKVPMYGKKHSEETKQKMSEDRKGNKHPMYGKKLSDSAKQAKSLAIKGRKWVNNGESQSQITINELETYLNKGYKLGMLSKTSKEKLVSM